MTECGISGVRWILGCFTAKGGNILQYDAERANICFATTQSFFFFVAGVLRPFQISNISTAKTRTIRINGCN